MLKVFLILLSNVFAQIGMSQTFLISPDLNNVLYQGVDNPLTVIVQNVNCEFIVLNGQGCQIKKVGCKYTINPDSLGVLKLLVFEKHNSRILKLGESNFRVRELEKPIARVGNIKERKTTARVLRVMGGVIATLGNETICADFYVISYHFMIISPNGTYLNIVNDGPKFNKQILDALERASINDRIVISDIKVQYPNGSFEYIMPIEYIISE